jgi:hypothetical protein
MDMHILSILKEKGGSYRMVTDIFNALCQEPYGLPPVGYKGVWGAMMCSNHVVTWTQKEPQASENALVWTQARYNACYQLLVRLGVEIPPNSIGAVVTDPATVDKKVIE